MKSKGSLSLHESLCNMFALGFNYCTDFGFLFVFNERVRDADKIERSKKRFCVFSPKKVRN